MDAWLTFPENVPSDQATIWVRIEYYYSKPFLATYDVATQSATSISNSITYPAYVIARWKYSE